jgi:hypothetical protein
MEAPTARLPVVVPSGGGGLVAMRPILSNLLFCVASLYMWVSYGRCTKLSVSLKTHTKNVLASRGEVKNNVGERRATAICLYVLRWPLGALLSFDVLTRHNQLLFCVCRFESNAGIV